MMIHETLPTSTFSGGRETQPVKSRESSSKPSENVEVGKEASEEDNDGDDVITMGK